MSISVNYLIRTGIIREFFNGSCSLFITDKITRNKLVFNITKPLNYIVKCWNLTKCNSNNALPPFEAFETENVFEDKRLIQENFSLLEFHHKGFPTNENKYNKPMSQETFELYFDGHLNNFANHKYRKEQWLWSEFLRIYHPYLLDFSISIKRNLRFFGKLAEKEIYTDQLNIVMDIHPNSWKYWLMWQKHMFDNSSVPGELIFQSSFSTME